MKAEINGNAGFVKTLHLFVENDGCYFPTEQDAMKNASFIGCPVGKILHEIDFEGKKWYRYTQMNVWD